MPWGPVVCALLLLVTAQCGRVGFGGASVLDPAIACETHPDADRYSTLGAGTRANPFLICTLAQFVDLSDHPEAWAAHYLLLSDLDLAEATGYSPIGNEDTPFSGTFDGRDNTVRNLSYQDTEANYIGLFGNVVGASSRISNLGVENVDLQGQDHIGGLVGRVQWGSIIHTYTTGIVRGRNQVGGAIGSAENSVTISSTYSTADVTGSNQYVGGLVGNVDGGRITSAYATGQVSGGFRGIGGLVGTFNFGAIIETYATGNVIGSQGAVGGLVGSSGSCVISHSFATGTVSCTSGVDNCGIIAGATNTSALPIFENIYYDSAAAAACTNAGTASCNAGHGTGVDLSAQPGYFHNPANEPLASWQNWNTPTTWRATAGGLPELAPVQFDVETWGTCLDHLLDEPFAGGSGTVEDPYLLCTATQLEALSSNPTYWRHNSFRLMDNINMSNIGDFTPIGDTTTAFWGALYGNGKTIENLSYDDSSRDNVGLFGIISYSLVKRVGVVDVAMTGRDSVGGLAGLVTRVNIVATYSTGSVTGRETVGGLIGRHHGKLANSYSSAKVTGNTNVGGITGVAGCSQCFATGSVIGTTQVNVGRAIGMGGSELADQVYYDGNSTCDDCDNQTGVAIDVGGDDPADYFYKRTNEPFVHWDFENTWLSRGNNYPTLR